MKFLGNTVIKIVTGGTKTTLPLLIDIYNGPSNLGGASCVDIIPLFDSGHEELLLALFFQLTFIFLNLNHEKEELVKIPIHRGEG